MLGNTFGLPHLIIILVIVLLLFGAPKLPGLARSISQSMKIFRTELKSDDKAVSDKAVAHDATDEKTGQTGQSGTTSTSPKTER